MNHPFTSRITAILCGIFLVLPAIGQTPQGGAQGEKPPAQQAQQSGQQPQNGQQAPALKVTTRLVEVSVIAQRGDGKPVTDMTKDDFVLLDKGQPQTISFFAMESTRMLAAAGREPYTPPSGFGPGTKLFSNRLEQREGVPNAVTVVLIDQLNTRFADMSYARAQVIKFLKQLQPQDRVAIYLLTDKVTVLHDFTSDATSLLRVLDKYRSRDSAQVEASEPEQVDSGDDQLDAFLNEANQRMATFYQVNRALTTAQAFEAIANHLARLPGRKNLIWVSGSFPFMINEDSLEDMQNFSYEIEMAARALNSADLAIYPVDARGLIAPQFRQGSVSARSIQRGKAPPLITMSPNQQNFATMNTLADRTGGRAFYNSNDIFGSIRKAIEDSQVTYVLGYYPSHTDWDGKWREIKVDSKRSGVHLRFRRGYFALPDSTPTAQQATLMLRDAVVSPLDFTTLGINVYAVPADVPGARQIRVEIQMVAKDVTLEQKDGRWVGEIQLVIVERDAEGKDLASDSKQISMHLSDDRYQAVLKNGLVWDRDLRIAPGTTQLRIVACDTASGAIGSVIIPADKLFLAPAH